MEHQIGLPGISEERLQEVEAELGFSLPSELRAYFKKENKFEAGEWQFHPIKDEQYIKRTWEDIVRVNSTDVEDYPNGFFRIATDGSGDELGYLLPDTKTIVLWVRGAPASRGRAPAWCAAIPPRRRPFC